MGQKSSIEDHETHDQQPHESSRPTSTRAAADKHIEYVYCIKLPFTCTTPQRAGGGPLRRSHRYRQQRNYLPYSLNRRPLRLPVVTPQFRSPTPGPHQVVKVGKSENPARRFHDILGAFRNLGIDVPLLRDILEADGPQRTIEKAKSCDPVVFLVKVRDIGTAEGDIRKLFGQSLGEGFINDFRKCLDEVDEDQKKLFDDHAGMTEWVLMDTPRVTRLREKFRTSPLFTHNSSPFSPGIPPTGKEIYQRLLTSESLESFNPRRRGQPPTHPHEVLITLPTINFSYTLKIQQ